MGYYDPMNYEEEKHCEKLVSAGWLQPEQADELIRKYAAENAALRTLLTECHTSMCHAEIFLTSREKMHPTGITLWQKLTDQIDANLRLREPITFPNGSALCLSDDEALGGKPG